MVSTAAQTIRRLFSKAVIMLSSATVYSIRRCVMSILQEADMRKKLYVLFAVVLLLASCETVPQVCVSVSEETIICGSDILVEDIRIPVITGFSDKEFEKALSDRIAAIVEQARQHARDQAKTVQQWVPYVCVLVVDYQVKSSCGLFSMRLSSLLDDGGTGMPQTVYFNADIAQNKWLTLDDLFVSGDYCAVIDAYIHKQIWPDERFSPEDFNGVSEKTAFFVSDGQLHVAFAKYEIASGMTGEPAFAIPIASIKKLLKPDYASFFYE